MTKRVLVFNVPIDASSFSEVLARIDFFISQKRPCQIITVNAEFLVHSQADDDFLAILKSSDLNTADGIGVLWAATYLSQPLNWPRFKKMQSLCQIVSTGLSVIFKPRRLRRLIPEKISGVDLFWKVSELAAEKQYPVYLLGGFDDTPQLVVANLLAKFENLNIVGSYGGSPQETGLAEKISAVKPAILFVAYGPVAQEKWIAENLLKLGVPVVIGLGGTFDYVAGKKPLAPNFLRHIGLEWAFRLITQPYRLFRVIKAVPVFIRMAFRYKYFADENSVEK